MSPLTNCLTLRPNHPPASTPSFQFMSLPTELRLTIASLALSHTHGFRWHWKSESTGHRIGTFVPKFPRKRSPSDIYRAYEPFTLLCVSRQLRHETLHLWTKTATLYFDGNDNDADAAPNGIWNPPCRRAVCAYEFFATHPRTLQLPGIPPLILNPRDFGALPSAVRHLIKVTQDPRLSDTRVVMPCGYAGEEAVRRTMMVYARHVYLSRGTMEWADGLEMERRWRIWPDPEFVGWVERIRGDVAEVFYEASVEFLRNGL